MSDQEMKPTACLALADGTVFYGHGFGAVGETTAELCFNTAMTGYQEIMTDPSYAGQIVTFTFPHIGNTGVNPEDDETADPVASGMIVKWDPTDASNWRSTEELTQWLARRGRIGMGGVDTRRLTRAIRAQGAPHVAMEHNPDGVFDLEALVAKARAFKPTKTFTVEPARAGAGIGVLLLTAGIDLPAIILRAQFLIRQKRIGRRDFFEPVGCGLVAWIHIRVQLFRQSTIRLANIRFGCGLGHAK